MAFALKQAFFTVVKKKKLAFCPKRQLGLLSTYISMIDDARDRSQGRYFPSYDLWKLAHHITDVISIWFAMKERFIYVELTSASHRNPSTLSQNAYFYI